MRTMPQRNEAVRINRLRWWIATLTLVPGALAALLGRLDIGSGLAAGGLIMVLNLLGTQFSISRLLAGEALERIAAVIVWVGKFGMTAAFIMFLLYFHLVDPLALLIGLGALPASIVFDIFLFPVNKGEAKIP